MPIHTYKLIIFATQSKLKIRVFWRICIVSILFVYCQNDYLDNSLPLFLTYYWHIYQCRNHAKLKLPQNNGIHLWYTNYFGNVDKRKSVYKKFTGILRNYGVDRLYTVFTLCRQAVSPKKLYSQRLQIAKIEGKTIPHISARVTDDQHAKLTNLIEKTLTPNLKQSDSFSDKLRCFIDHFDDYYILRNSPSPKQEEFFTCPLTHEAVKMKDLPCLQDPNFGCRNTLCRQALKAHLGL